jgi:hypothetical protein
METMKKNGTLKDGQAVPALYISHAPERNCRELAPPVPQFGYFYESYKGKTGKPH